MLEIPSGKVPYRLRLTLTEVGEDPLTMLSLTSFLYDLLVLHDRLVLFSSKYKYYYNPHWSFKNRSARERISKSDRLQVELITKKSPFIIDILIPTAAVCAGTALTLIKILEKRRDWANDKDIKRLTKESLEMDVIKKRRDLGIEQQLDKNEYAQLFTGARYEKGDIEDGILEDTKRIDSNEQLEITDIEILEYTNKNEEDYGQ